MNLMAFVLLAGLDFGPLPQAAHCFRHYEQ